MRKYLTALLLLVSIPLWSQSPSSRDARLMNLRMLNTLDEYIRTSSLSDTRDTRSFLRLFEEQDSPSVYNDLMGTATYQDIVTPQQYIDLLGTEATSMLRTEISEVRKDGDFFMSDGKWHRIVLLQKYVMYIDGSVYTGDSGGILFDSDQLYADRSDYQLSIDFVFDDEDNSCRIQKVSIEDAMPPSPVDNDFFYVVLKPEESRYADRIYSAGRNYVTFNSFNQAVVPEISSLRVDDGDVVLKSKSIANSSKYGVIELAFKHYRMRLKPRYGMSLGNAFSFTVSPASVGFQSSSKATEIGLDFGPSFRLGPDSRLILYTGAAFSASNVQMSASNFQYDVPSLSSEGKSYSRHYNIDTVSEELSFKEIMIPAYFELEFSIGRFAMLSFDIGGKVYLSMDNSTSPFHVKGSSSATPEYDSVNTGPFDSQFTRFIAPASYGKEPFDVSAFGGGELDIRIFGPMYVYAAAGYEYGLLPAFKSSESNFLGNNIYPVVYERKDGLAYEEIAYHSFVDCITFYRRSPWLSFGLKIKL